MSNLTKKDRNLIKGAIRRVFSRSELRNLALSKNDIEYIDINRPRVTRWSFCNECGVITPRYQMQVDHIVPVVNITETLEDINWDELIEKRIWCSISNLNPMCLSCHKAKSKQENKERRAFKKLQKTNYE